MLATARKYYFWPKMKYNVAAVVEKCEECQVYQPTQPNDKPIVMTASSPMEKLSIDIFEFKGKHHLIVVDRYSGLLWIRTLRSLATSSITDKLDEIFKEFRYLQSVRTDRGPQFRREFKQFCDRSSIRHEPSSRYHPQSNGQAKVNVWIIKHLMAKTTPLTFNEAFSKFKNTECTQKPAPQYHVLWTNPPPPATYAGFQTANNRRPRSYKLTGSPPANPYRIQCPDTRSP